MARIDILLATYNGGRFLAQQLQSLTDQTCDDWRLIVRDDGSNDDTLVVLGEWAERTGAEMMLLEDGETGCGACENFARLLAASDAPYFAFCDQDDVWKPEKLFRLLTALQDAEREHASALPMLAFCDLVPVTEQLEPISNSFRAFCGLSIPSPARMAGHLMLQNVVTGCAMMGNAALRDTVGTVPSAAMMHDWWLALVAATMGQIVDVPDALVLYRQHGANAIGARRSTLTDHALRFAREPLVNFRHARDWVQGASRQSAVFANTYRGRLDDDIFGLYRSFGEARQHGFVRRKLFPIRHHAQSNSLARIVAASIFL